MHQQYQFTKVRHCITGLITAALRLNLRPLCVVIMLPLIMAGTGQTAPVEAVPSGDASGGYWLYAQQVGGDRTICVGDKVSFRVMVQQKINLETEYSSRRPGVEVEAQVVEGSGVGTISPPQNTTSLSNVPFGSTYFTFSAERPGLVTIRFTGKVGTRKILGLVLTSSNLTAEKQLKVEDCQYKVTTFSRWDVPGEANIHAVASFAGAGMTEVGGGLYKGTADVEWRLSASPVGDCTFAVTTASSQAHLTGLIFGPELLVVDVDYDTAMANLLVDCGQIGGSRQIQMTPAPVDVSLPVAGGAEMQSQILRGPESTPGKILIYVKRGTPGQ